MMKAYFVALATALLVLPGAGSHSVLAEQDSERTPNETTEVAPETAPLTPAQTIIFNTPHLKDITGPTTLNYRFERKSAFKDGFTDDVKVNIDRILEDGSKDVSFDFFSGDRNRPYPPVERFKGNPIIMVFLQRDAWEMARLLRGDANYFRNQVRNGFLDAAEVTDVEVQTANGPVKAQKVTLRPFLHDRNAYHMGPNTRKGYEFTLSPEIPGQVYMIRTFVPPEPSAKKSEDEAGGGTETTEMTIEETLVFESATPAKKSAARTPNQERSEE
jgi:hypothetical protein